MKQNTSFGRNAEDLACRLLAGKNYKIIDRNFRSRFGEIDIVALHDNCLKFIEVKARTSSTFGFPEEAVTKSKLDKIVKTSQYYSLLHPNLSKNLRIEVVALEFCNEKISSIKIIPVY